MNEFRTNTKILTETSLALFVILTDLNKLASYSCDEHYVKFI